MESLKLRSAVLVAAGLLAASVPAWSQTVTRGPYLQQANQSSVIVRWRTDVSTDSQVKYGTSQGSLTLTATISSSTTEHIVQLSNLTADTKYFYTVGSTSGALTSNDGSYFFQTSPMPGTAKATRIWAIGDFGTGTSGQTATRDAYYTFAGTRNTDVWLMLGDNAYNSGLDSEYQSNVFNIYPTLFRKAIVWPTIGNHDAVNQSVYYSIFTLPTGGEAGGLASGTEHYYSFDYGNIHFMCLDSQTSDRSAGGAMATWVQNDAGSTTRDWIIAYWHAPPYSYGTHNSDTETELIDMRTVFNPILESAGVDLVLCGHSHVYERSYLINGHYGTGSTFNSSMIVDGGSGNPAYSKPAGTAANAGAVYTVCGCSGASGSLSGTYPAMYAHMGGITGSMVIDVNGTQLDAKFLKSDGTIQDTFSIVKGSSAPVAPTITSQPSDQTVVAGQTATFSVTATGTAPLSYQWQKNGSNIGGATSSSYTTPATVQGDDGSTFRCIVSNAAGSATSNSATLTVTPAGVAPTITTQPLNQTVKVGKKATFSVTATGTAPLSYQWKKNGSTISGATSSSYTTPTAALADSGSTYLCVVTNSVGSATSDPAILTVNKPGGALPSPFVSQDVGTPGIAGGGYYDETTGTFIVVGSGADIFGTSDQFDFAYQPLTGDGEIIALVSSLENTDAWAKAGVMIRESLAANSTYAFTAVTPGNDAVFQRRTTTGGSAASTGGPEAAAPFWVRLVRSGNTFTSYASPDGSTWTLIGTDTITMTTNVYIGFAVTSHVDTTLTTATFDSAAGSGGWTPPPSVAPASSSGGGGHRCGVTGAEGSLILGLVLLGRRVRARSGGRGRVSRGRAG